MPVGQALQLAARVEAGDFVDYHWELGDGATAAGPSVAHIYSQPGTYTVRVTAQNEVSMVAAQLAVTIIEPAPEPAPTPDPTPDPQPSPTPNPEPGPTPTPDPSPEPSPEPTPQPEPDDETPDGIGQLHVDAPATVQRGQKAHFRASVSSGAQVAYVWDIAGVSREGAEVEHIFDAVGAYAVRIVAVNGVGQAEAVVTVNVTEVSDTPTPDNPMPDDADPDGTDPNDTDPDQETPDDGTPDNQDPDGTEPDGTEPDGTEPGGTDSRHVLFAPALTR